MKATCIVYDSQGVSVAGYDKIYLFDVRVSEHEAHQESLTAEPRRRIVVDIDLPRLTQLRRQFPCHEHHVLYSGKVPL